MDGKYDWKGVLYLWALAVAVLVFVSCQDNVGLEVEGEGCDSLVCPPVPPDTVSVVDTLIDSFPYPVVDSVFVWCVKVGWDDGRQIFRCDNGYVGPII